MIKQWSPLYDLLRLLLDSKYFIANLQSRASCPTRHSLVKGKKYHLHLNKWKEEICAHTSVLCCMFSFLISNSEALQSPELRTFLLSEIIKRPLNYHLMVILPATCRLKNPVTTLNERHFFMATTSLHLDYSFLKMIIWFSKKVTTHGQSYNPDPRIPPKHLTITLQKLNGSKGWNSL